MSTGKIRAINCTSCGAPLTLHGGGHKIRTLNCEFCGAVLDARKEYSVLAKYSEVTPPRYSPLKAGMEGEINGVHFTVIGIVAWKSIDDDWVDYQVFSQTHGYAWLSYEGGHWVFTRRVRDTPHTRFRSLAPKSLVTIGERTYRFFESYSAKITYVSGELTSIAKVGDETYIADSVDPPYMFSQEGNVVEVEHYLSEYIFPELITESFGASNPMVRWGVHPAQPYQSKFLTPFSKNSLPFVLIALLAVIFIRLFMSGEIVLREHIDSQTLLEGTTTQPFEVTQPNRLVSLEMNAQLNNAWAGIEVTILKDQEPLFSIEKEVSYYSGRDRDGNWSEGRPKATARFLLPEAAVYTLEVVSTENGTWGRSNLVRPASLTITVREGYVSPYYFQILLVLCALFAAIGPFFRWSFEERRWKPVLDEDD